MIRPLPVTARRPTAAVVPAVLVLLPVLAVVVLRSGREWFPLQDFAVIDLRVRDVWSANVPLTGPYSRFGWNHPGPLMYWLIAPLSLVTGRAAWATQVGAALLQGVAVAWLARLTYRAGGPRVMAGWLALLGLSYAATGPWILLQPWNPHVAYPFFVLFLAQAWLVAAGRRGLLPGAAFVASFLVQTHVGYAPLVVAVGAWALLVARRTLPEEGRRLRHLPGLRAAGLLAALLWVPVLLDCALHPPGNLPRVVHSFVAGQDGQAALGPVRAARVLAVEFRLPPPWLGGRDVPAPITGWAAQANPAWLLLPVVLLAGGLLAARRAGNRAGVRLVVLAGLLLALTLVVLSAVRGDPFPYLFYWRIPVAILAVGAGPVAAIGSPGPGRPAVRAVATVVAVVLAVAPAAGMTRQIARRAGAVPTLTPVAERFAAELRGPGRNGPVLVRFAGSALGGLEGGIVDDLARHGVDVRVDEDRARQFGPDRGARPGEVRQVWVVVEQGARLSILGDLPGARVLVRSTSLPADAESRLVALQREVAGELVRAHRADLLAALDSPLVPFAAAHQPGVPAAQLTELAALNERATRDGPCRCAVIAFPPGQAPTGP